MELRLVVAYGLMALLALFVVGLALWLRYNSRDRIAARARRRDREAYERRMAARASGKG
jgi:hypothetical protein